MKFLANKLLRFDFRLSVTENVYIFFFMCKMEILVFEFILFCFNLNLLFVYLDVP
jgi:hypothetical protein